MQDVSSKGEEETAKHQNMRRCKGKGRVEKSGVFTSHMAGKEAAYLISVQLNTERISRW